MLSRSAVERFLIPRFYAATTRLMALALSIFGRWEVSGADQMPRFGPVIVVANHLNLADPPLLGASLPRRIRFMAKQELFEARVAGIFIRLFGAFPVRRFESDLRALRSARRLLDQGEVVGMFPEGHRSGGSGMIPAHPGTALLALQSGAPILPVGITGSQVINSLGVVFRRPRITVRVGETFTLPRPDRIDAASVRSNTEIIMRRIAQLLPASYRGAYTYEEVG
jgi:1-acyl-sn-glycerol-3-phosphate acyltransferase